MAKNIYINILEQVVASVCRTWRLYACTLGELCTCMAKKMHVHAAKAQCACAAATLCICGAMTLCACSSDNGGGDTPVTPPTPSTPTEKLPLRVSSVPEASGTDDAFETGDRMGVFVVNRNADGSAVALKAKGNYIDNSLYTFQGTWTPTVTEYWKDNTTHADFYMYYPYTATIASVEALPWSVKTDQSTPNGYKASELLMGKALDVAPSENDVHIDARHIMAQAVVTLEAGKGFTTASLANADISVRINNLKTQAIANLATGLATPTGGTADIVALKEGGTYKALVVPQTLYGGNLITVTADGTEYSLPKDPQLTAFEQGHRYQFTVTLSKTSGGMNVDIVKWQDDGVDYGGVAEPE